MAITVNNILPHFSCR